MPTITRKFDLGDLVISRRELEAVANGDTTISKAAATVEGVRESFAADRVTVQRNYVLNKGVGVTREEYVYPIMDAKKVIMKILAERMQAVAEMEVPNEN